MLLYHSQIFLQIYFVIAKSVAKGVVKSGIVARVFEHCEVKHLFLSFLSVTPANENAALTS